MLANYRPHYRFDILHSGLYHAALTCCEPMIKNGFYRIEPGKKQRFSICADIVDWLSGCKYEFIPYLQNNWTFHVSKESF